MRSFVGQKTALLRMTTLYLGALLAMTTSPPLVLRCDFFRKKKSTAIM
jgi:hypothetical protein